MLDLQLQIGYFFEMMKTAIKSSFWYLISAGLIIYGWESLNHNIYSFVGLVFAIQLAYTIFTVGRKVNLNDIKKDIIESERDGQD